MAVYPVTGGRPDYSGNFIPEIWSGKLIENFYDATVLAQITNTDYEGEIKAQGDTVNIRQVPEITIRSYAKGETLINENPDKEMLKLLIDQGEYFSCVLDDIDRRQSDIMQMEKWSKDASERMKIKIDSKVLANMPTGVAAINKGNTAGRISQNLSLGATGSPVALTKSNVLDKIIDLGTALDEANAPEEGRFIVMPAKACALIKRSDLHDASVAGDSTSIMRNGRVGMIDRFTIYHSNLVSKNSSNEFMIVAGHKMGMTFASQLVEMEDLRLESTFGTAIRGLQVYGYKVVKPEALALLVATL